MQETGVEKAIRYFGSISKLARKLKINREKIYRYREGASPIPSEIAEAIEHLTEGRVKRKELLPWRIKNYFLVREAPCISRKIIIEDIIISHEIPPFLDQKDLSPSSQKPICVDENNQLIYGLEAIEACKKQGKKSVLAWRISLLALLDGKYQVDDLVKAFDPIERTAIGISLEIYIGNRQGFRTDLMELVENYPQVSLEKGTKTRNRIVDYLGFGSDYTYRQLKKILQSNCCSDLIRKVRHSKIPLSKAVALANLPLDKQIT